MVRSLTLIQNCTITLNRAYPNSIGIFSTTQQDSTLATTSISTAPGENTGNSYRGNTISNVNQGIAIIGTSSFFE
jgi:hypothetical protein